MKARAVAAAFRLGLRAPLRSRLVMALLPLLAAAALALPFALDADGGDAASLGMVVTWPLGAAFAVLAAASLWAGSAAVASEIEGKRFVSDAVSPASAFDIWCGRWLGLVALDAALLALVVAAVFFVARHRAPEAAREPSRALLRRDRAYDAELAGRLAGGDRALAREALEDMLSGAYLPVSPGEGRAWRFKLPKKAQDSVRLDFSCLSAYGVAQGVDGSLAVRPVEPGSPDIVRFALSKDGDGTFSAEIPGTALSGLSAVDVAFENGEDRETGAGALVSHVDSVRLSVPGRGLAANLALAWVAMLAALSLVAALGLACGCAFSPPVAAFVATGAAIAVMASGSSQWTSPEPAHSHGEEPDAPGPAAVALGRASTAAAATLRLAVAPAVEAAPLGRLGDGVSITAGDAAMAAAGSGVAVPLLLGLAGAATLRRRELP